MIDVLESLEALPGVELALLFTQDGVPVASAGTVPGASSGHGEAGPMGSSREQAVAALAGGWANELGHAIAPLTWGGPNRVVLRCARGSMVLRRMRNATLLLMLERGVDPEVVRLPMEGATAKIERSLRSKSDRSEPPAPMPSRPELAVESHAATLDTSTTGELSRD